MCTCPAEQRYVEFDHFGLENFVPSCFFTHTIRFSIHWHSKSREHFRALNAMYCKPNHGHGNMNFGHKGFGRRLVA